MTRASHPIENASRDPASGGRRPTPRPRGQLVLVLIAAAAAAAAAVAAAALAQSADLGDDLSVAPPVPLHGPTAPTDAAPLVGTFLAAVRAAPRGRIVELPEGDVRLHEDLDLEGGWHIRGAGSARTRVVVAPTATLLFLGIGAVTIEGITFEREAPGRAPMVTVDGDIVLLVDEVRFIGGPAGAPLADVGIGLEVFTAAPGSVVRRSTFERHGSGLAHRTSLTIEESSFTNNLRGLEVAGRGTGRVRQSVFSANGRGVSVVDDAAPELEGLRVSGSTSAGVVFSYGAGGVLARSDIDGTWGPGVVVSGSSAPSIVGNRLRGNDVGILVLDDAAPRLEHNVISDSYYYGIHYCCRSAGRAWMNRIERSGQDAISLRDSAMPALEENTLRGNGWSGISYRDASGGVARSNVADGNGNAGIVVQGTSAPTLIDNRLHGNIEAGIEYYDEAGGAATGNVCVGNETGIELWQSASPRLSNNACALMDIRPTVPTEYLVNRPPPVRGGSSTGR
jgi:parallel beta-helix repeat protein